MGTRINANGTSVQVDVQKKIVILNGEAIPFAAGMTGKSISIHNNEVAIDGQVYRAGQWEKRN